MIPLDLAESVQLKLYHWTTEKSVTVSTSVFRFCSVVWTPNKTLFKSRICDWRRINFLHVLNRKLALVSRRPWPIQKAGIQFWKVLIPGKAYGIISRSLSTIIISRPYRRHDVTVVSIILRREYPSLHSVYHTAVYSPSLTVFKYDFSNTQIMTNLHEDECVWRVRMYFQLSCLCLFYVPSIIYLEVLRNIIKVLIRRRYPQD